MFLVIVALSIPAIAWAQRPAAPAASSEARTLCFVDEHGSERHLAHADIAKLPRTTIKVSEHDGKRAEYEGVQVAALLQAQGIRLGKELRGPRIASYILIEARDGYRIVLSIAEVDPATTGKVVLLADRKNGAPLTEQEGPWRLIVPDDKRPVRWIRMIQRITIRSATAAEKPK